MGLLHMKHVQHSSWTPLACPSWRDIPLDEYLVTLNGICGRFHVQPRGETNYLSGDVAFRYLSRFETASISHDAQAIRRDANMIRQDPGEHLFLIIQDYGTCTIQQGSNAAKLVPGSMYLADSLVPSEFIYHGSRSRQFSIHLPREEAVLRFSTACTGGVVIDPFDPLHQAMQCVLMKLINEQGRAATALGETFMGLLGSYFLSIQLQQSPAERHNDAFLDHVLSEIGRLAHDPCFDVDELAARLGISRRSLQRHLQRIGETASGLILNCRLERAHARLAQGEAATTRGGISAIAYASGFNDLSYFYRAFGKRYGKPPGRLGAC